MIKPEQIPDEVVEAAARAFAAIEDGNELLWDAYIPYAEYAIAAAINAWPGMGYTEDVTGWDVHIELPLLVVPLPQEKNDE